MSANSLHRKLWRAVSRRVRAGAPAGHYFSEWSGRFGSEDDVENAFSIFANWVTDYGGKSRRYGASDPKVSDQDARITQFDEVAPVRGRSVLEIGPLEAGHTKQMLDRGATDVTAIESNPEAYLKCLLVKDVLGLEHARFVFGDANAVLARYASAGVSFDLCSAVGVLYHMENPLTLIELITKLAPIVYVWTHVAPGGPRTGEWTKVTDSAGRSYEGRFNYYDRNAHLGGIARRAVWLTESSLRSAFSNFGHEIQMIERGSHPHGEIAVFVSRRPAT